MDSLLEEVGSFGRFQKLSTFLLSALSSVAAMVFYVTIFTTAEPELKCYPTLNSTINVDQNGTLDTCFMWANYSLSNEMSQSTEYFCEFDTSVYTLTIINDWGLVCDKAHLAALTQTLFLIGNISGFLSGIVSDKYGRKMATIIFLGLFAIISIIFNILFENYQIFWLSASTRFILYSIFQLLSGILSCCFQISLYVHLIEFTTDDYHILVNNIMAYFYIGGEIFVLIVFYLSRNWITTTWLITIFSVVGLIPFIYFIPESPRWLTEMNRFDDSYEALKFIAKWNKKKNYQFNKESTKKLMQQYKTETELITKINHSEVSNNEKTINIKRKLIDLSHIFGENFSCTKLFALFLVANFMTLIYVGVTVGITSLLDINPYVIFVFSSLFELFGIFACHLNDYIGRKRSMLLFTFCLGICSFIVAFIPEDPTDSDSHFLLILKTIFTLLARIFISAAYNTFMIYAAELYEVKIRNSVLAFLICAGNLLSLVSPQINLLEEFVWAPFPYLIYSTCGILSTVIVLFLPETYHSHSKNGI